MDNCNPDEAFVDDSRAFLFCEKDILDSCRCGDDEAEGEEKEAIPTDPVAYMEEFRG